MLLPDGQPAGEVALIPELEPVISNHGLEGVFVGTIFEGEGVLLAASVLAHPRAAIFLLQYLYGVRMAGALALGLTRISWRRFALYEAANCLLWAALFTTAGYLLGSAAAGFLHGRVRWLWTAASLAVLLLVVRRLSARALGAPRRS